MDKLDLIDDNYSYNAVVTNVYDGDTITVEIDLGFKIKVSKKIRLFGIDTYELRGDEREKGLKAKKFTSNKVLNKKVKLNTLKDKKGKYGRYLAVVYYLEKDKYVNLNKELIKNNHGKLFMI